MRAVSLCFPLCVGVCGYRSHCAKACMYVYICIVCHPARDLSDWCFLYAIKILMGCVLLCFPVVHSASRCILQAHHVHKLTSLACAYLWMPVACMCIVCECCMHACMHKYKCLHVCIAVCETWHANWQHSLCSCELEGFFFQDAHAYAHFD